MNLKSKNIFHELHDDYYHDEDEEGFDYEYKKSTKKKTNMFTSSSSSSNAITEEDNKRFKFKTGVPVPAVVDVTFQIEDSAFPDLIKAPEMQQQQQQLPEAEGNMEKNSSSFSFIESLKKERIILEEPVVEESHLDVYTFDKRTRKMSYQKPTSTPQTTQTTTATMPISTEDIEFGQLIDTLIKRHSKWRRDYIRSWGQEEYDKMYRGAHVHF